MKDHLEVSFIGKGEVRGYTFEQINHSDKGYVYKVSAMGASWYEVFRHKINNRFGGVQYPKSPAFGLWVWTFKGIEQASAKFSEL